MDLDRAARPLDRLQQIHDVKGFVIRGQPVCCPAVEEWQVRL